MIRLVVALILLVATSAVAGVKQHTVRSGESASSIAKRYYGNYALSDLLLRFNDGASSVIHPGQQLRVPYSELHRVESGDTWSVLAERYTGRSSTYAAIALLNDLAPGAPLRVGQRLRMPVGVPYRLDHGDTLQGIALRFYGDASGVRTLQAYNDIDDPRRLSVGRMIEVPLTTLMLHEQQPKPQPVVNRAPVVKKPTPIVAAPPPPAPEPKFHRAIDAARDAYDRGEYARAWNAVETLRERVLTDGSDEERRELLRLETFVHVAFDRAEQACAAYRGLLEVEPRPAWDRDLVSPKIRKALVRCGERS